MSSDQDGAEVYNNISRTMISKREAPRISEINEPLIVEISSTG